jgi:ABC-type proline/glycine betaine transport system substrate-binding protein
MKSTLHALAALVALLTLTTAAFAQEEAEAAQQVAPQGLGLMMLLVGLAAILVVGLFMGRRESGDADDLV